MKMGFFAVPVLSVSKGEPWRNPISVNVQFFGHACDG
jgi:hypothetical protein